MESSSPSDYRVSIAGEFTPRQLEIALRWAIENAGQEDRVERYVFNDAFNERPEQAAEALDWLSASNDPELRRMVAANIDRLLPIDRDRCMLMWSQLLLDNDADVRRAAEERLAAHAVPDRDSATLTRDDLFALILLAQSAKDGH